MTTQHPKSNFGVDDPKFKYALILGIPLIPVILGIIISFSRCYFLNCDTPDTKQLADYFGYGVFIIGLIVFGLVQRVTKRLYNKGELIWSALDRQNDQCYVCKESLPEDKGFYFNNDKVYCLKHNPFEIQKNGDVK